MNTDVNKLVKECENKTSWKNVKSLFHSFTDNFDDYKKFIADNKLEGGDIDKFIEICNIKIERAKTLLSDVATVLGFDITAISIILALSFEEGKMTKTSTPFMTMLGKYGIPFNLFFTILILGAFVGILMLVHHRTHIHAWSAFKEAAILNEKYSLERNKKC